MRSMADVSKLFDYNRWANGRTLESVSGLTLEEFAQHLGGSFPSVRETLAHIYGAEWIWLQRWLGASPTALPGAHQFFTVEELRQKWDGVEEERRAFLRAIDDSRLSETVHYANLKGDRKSNALGDLFVHLVNHSTYHRGQVATMLRQLGKKPNSTDYTAFLDTQSA